MGTELLTTFLTFVAASKSGARLTLQHNGSGFTVQVTEAVERAYESHLDPETFKRLWGLVSHREQNDG